MVFENWLLNMFVVLFHFPDGCIPLSDILTHSLLEDLNKILDK